MLKVFVVFDKLVGTAKWLAEFDTSTVAESLALHAGKRKETGKSNFIQQFFNSDGLSSF